LFDKLCTILYKDGDERTHSYALKIVGNMTIGTDLQTQRLIDEGLLDLFTSYLNTSSFKVLKETIWSISNVAGGCLSHITLLYESKILDTIVKYIVDLTPQFNENQTIKIVIFINIDSKGMLLCINISIKRRI
jgi:hypothetical protein